MIEHHRPAPQRGTVQDANEAAPKPKVQPGEVEGGSWKGPKGKALTLLERSLGERSAGRLCVRRYSAGTSTFPWALGRPVGGA